ncbi:MAG: M48 family metallopeptidase [Candidatus Roizmanbacteria bacterium]|nr:MAG: M48 family metallopeptidase [Candidatus Roizmanbacteria bacterium]
MTVYNQISTNKLKTYLIIFIFILLMSGFFFIIGKFFQNPGLYFAIGISFSLISSLGSYFYSDKIVLFTTGAKPASKKEHFNFYTVTENLAIATGMPMPKLYVMDDQSMNAFATGRDPKHAVVAATTGLLERLDRAELEGVIAHELSHIKNYDILLASIVAVLVGTIALVSDWIMRSLWWRGNDDRRENRSPLLFVLLIIALILTPIVATLIQLTVSRKREFLADATGALITRYPEGLARALEKISGDRHVSTHATSSTAHLFIANPFKKGKGTGSWLASLFSTHPPVEERIRILRNL